MLTMNARSRRHAGTSALMDRPADLWENTQLAPALAESIPDLTIDPLVARITAAELAALTRVLFGVSAPHFEPPVLTAPREAPAHRAEPSTPVTTIAVPDPIPAPQPRVYAPAHAGQAAPTSLPVPELPVPAAVTHPAENSVPAPRETYRRPAGPSLELLQEIAFLED